MVNFNTEEDKKLIELVRAQKILWNIKHPDRKNQFVREQVWRAIGKSLNREGSEVKSRWRTIRDNYMRNNNRNPKKRKRAIYWGMCKFLDAGKAREKNSFDEATMPVSVEMKYEENDSNGIGSENEIGHDLDIIDKEFQDSVYQHPVGLALNLECPSEKEIRDNDTTSTLTQYLPHAEEDKPQFRKFLQDLMKATPQEDEIDVFFKSMAMTVKKFRPDLITKAKVNVFNSVMEFEVLNQKT